MLFTYEVMKRNDSCIVPFHTVLNASFTAGAAAISVSPNTSLSPTRLPAAADEWAHFRVKSLSFRLHPRTSVTADQVAGFVGGTQDTLPATLLQVGELIPSVPLGGDSTVPTEWVRCSRQELAGPFPWYKSVVGGADPTEESPGYLVIVGSATDNYMLEVRGEFEFKTAIATGNSPVAIELRARLRAERLRSGLESERSRITSILALSSTVATKRP